MVKGWHKIPQAQYRYSYSINACTTGAERSHCKRTETVAILKISHQLTGKALQSAASTSIFHASKVTYV
jgi:hypothetical protein